MLEMIRRQLLNRFEAKTDGAATATALICPKIVKKLERHKDIARNYICNWKSVGTFEADHYFEARKVVDMNQLMCSCGRWQLNGIPCAHAIAAMYFDKKIPEDYVHRWYHMDTFREAYRPPIHSMPGPDEWPKEDYDIILSPQVRRQPGRPRIARRKAPDEPDETYKVTRQGYVYACKTCKMIGHNARTCPKRKSQQSGWNGGPSQESLAAGTSQPPMETTHDSSSRPTSSSTRKKMTPKRPHHNP